MAHYKHLTLDDRITITTGLDQGMPFKRIATLPGKDCTTCQSARRLSFCWFCGQRNAHCAQFLPESCPFLLRPPYVCNGCRKRLSCPLEKYLYDVSLAFQNAKIPSQRLALGRPSLTRSGSAWMRS